MPLLPSALVSVNWVMVPVPEELAEEANAFLVRLRMQALLPMWDVESATEHLSRLDDDQRAALAAIVRSVLSTGPVTATDLADTLGISEREVLGLVSQLNEVRVSPPRGELVYVRSDEGRSLHMFDVIAAVFEEAGATAPAGRPAT